MIDNAKPPIWDDPDLIVRIAANLDGFRYDPSRDRNGDVHLRRALNDLNEARRIWHDAKFPSALEAESWASPALKSGANGPNLRGLSYLPNLPRLAPGHFFLLYDKKTVDGWGGKPHCGNLDQQPGVRPMRKTEITVPHANGTRKVRGHVMRFDPSAHGIEGMSKLKIFLQDGEDGSYAAYLTDYHSGQIMIRMQPYYATHAARRPNTRLGVQGKRLVCQIALAETIKNTGVDQILRTLTNAPKINP